MTFLNQELFPKSETPKIQTNTKGMNGDQFWTEILISNVNRYCIEILTEPVLCPQAAKWNTDTAWNTLTINKSQYDKPSIKAQN